MGEVTRKQASDTLAQRMAAGGNRGQPTRSQVVFRILAAKWQAHVLPMYKHSTQKNHRHILEKHPLPRLGDKAMTEITRHIHDVLSAVLRTAVKWGHPNCVRSLHGAQQSPVVLIKLPTAEPVEISQRPRR